MGKMNVPQPLELMLMNMDVLPLLDIVIVFQQIHVIDRGKKIVLHPLSLPEMIEMKKDALHLLDIVGVMLKIDVIDRGKKNVIQQSPPQKLLKVKKKKQQQLI